MLNARLRRVLSANQPIESFTIVDTFEAELLDQFSQQDRDMIRFAAGEFSAQEKAKL